LYDENFTGAAATTLNGQIPDVDQNGGSNQWRAHTNFTADGNMNPPAGGTGAFLPFIPTAGFVYTLSASLTNVTTVSNNWMAIGFAESVPANAATTTGNDYRFISGASSGKAWMLFRGQFSGTGLTHQTHRGSADVGTATPVDWSASFAAGGNIDLQIVLDTNAATWTATYYAKLPTDGSYTQVSAGALPLVAQDIGAIGFAASGVSTAIDATMTNFTLETNGPVTVPGDVDGNGIVNALDFNIIRDNLFTNVASRTLGDLNSDGTVNFTDFRLWKSVASAEVLAEIGAFGVPEPASCGLIVLAGLGLVAARRRFSTNAS
jgi:hypothetical protein